jgi:hypothetical protein
MKIQETESATQERKQSMRSRRWAVAPPRIVLLYHHSVYRRLNIRVYGEFINIPGAMAVRAMISVVCRHERRRSYKKLS